MIDITIYGEQELSLQVYNTEWLYRQLMVCEDTNEVTGLVDGEFYYTNEQLQELIQDWTDDSDY